MNLKINKSNLSKSDVMRTDKDGKMWTLEQDIQYIWKQHGLRVTSEEVENNTWTIRAVRDE